MVGLEREVHWLARFRIRWAGQLLRDCALDVDVHVARWIRDELQRVDVKRLRGNPVLHGHVDLHRKGFGLMRIEVGD